MSARTLRLSLRLIRRRPNRQAASGLLNSLSTGGHVSCEVPASPWVCIQPHTRGFAGVTSRLLNVSSAEQLLASLDAIIPQEVRRTGTGPLQENVPQRPRRLTSQPFLFGKRISAAYDDASVAQQFVDEIRSTRGPTILAVAEGLSDRKNMRAKVSDDSADQDSMERQLNPIVAFQSAPGGGKSAMLDVLALMSARGLWSEAHCPDAGMRAILNSSVPIPVTYNSGCDPHPGTYDKDVETGLALRILWTYFIVPTKMKLAQFWSLVPEKSTISASHAVDCCRRDANRVPGGSTRAILLLVDEMVKLTRAVPNAPLGSLLGALISSDTPEQLNVVCTTLDSIVLSNTFTGFDRKIHWAPLTPFGQENASTLMLEALNAAETRRLERTGNTTASTALKSLPAAVRIAISDAAGHPRSLQYVMEAMLELHAEGGLEALAVQPQGSAERQGGLKVPLELLRKKALKRFSPQYAPSFRAVQVALRGEAVELKAAPLGDGRQLADLIADGIFINTDVTVVGDAAVSFVVPKLSMLRLLQFARAVLDDDTPLPVHMKRAAHYIIELARVEEEGAAEPSPHLTCDYFERFVASWLRLMSVLRHGEAVSVLQLFHADNLVASPRHDVHPSLQLPFVLTHGQDPPWLAEAETQRFAAAVQQTKGYAGGQDAIARFGNDNPAFAFLLTATCKSEAPTSYVAVAIETRMSRVGVLKPDGDLDDKLKGFREALPVFRMMRPAPAHVVYVYAAARKMKDVAALQVRHAAEGVLVLADNVKGEPAPIATLRNTFTPSLADRVFFLLQLSC